jgi:hypothetical protein
MSDLWTMADSYDARASGKKIARLVPKGKDIRTVRYLVKLHDWSGRAIYIIDLVTAELRHIPRPSDQHWNQCKDQGTQIPHPGGIQATDVAAWVKYGKEQAARLGLDVA